MSIKQKIEFSRFDDKTLAMYSSDERYCYLGTISKEESFKYFSTSQKKKIETLFLIEE